MYYVEGLFRFWGNLGVVHSWGQTWDFVDIGPAEIEWLVEITDFLKFTVGLFLKQFFNKDLHFLSSLIARVMYPDVNIKTVTPKNYKLATIAFVYANHFSLAHIALRIEAELKAGM